MGSKIVFDKETDRSKLIKAVRLKDYLDRKIDFLKIDIEGAEYQVFRDIRIN